jgi:hypothetical protein
MKAAAVVVEGGMVVARVSGDGEPGSLELLQIVATAARESGCRSVLLDLRGRGGIPTADQARELARRITVSDVLRECAIAVVAAADGLYGMARMVGMLAEPRGGHLAIFREEEEARAWLAAQREGPPGGRDRG